MIADQVLRRLNRLEGLHISEQDIVDFLNADGEVYFPMLSCHLLLTEGAMRDRLFRILKKIAAGVMIGATLSSVAFANDWETKDYALLGGALAATYADAVTTKQLLARGGQETNPLYGTRHPSGADIDTGTILAAGGMVFASLKLPSEYRSAFLAGWMGIEATLAYDNAHTGGTDEPSSFSKVTALPLVVGALGAALSHYLPGGLGVSVSTLDKHPDYRLSYIQQF
jgi:hypothetical protein